MLEKDRVPKGDFKRSNPYKANSEVTKILMDYRMSRNEFTLGFFQRIESSRDAIVTKVIDMALEGNEKVLLYVMDRCMNHNLINRLEKTLVSRTVEDIDNSQQFVIEKMGEGSIDVTHGMNLVKTLALKRDTINVRELECQVRKVVENEQKTV